MYLRRSLESVWPLNASLYASSTCVHLRLLAGPFAQDFTGLLVWRKWEKFNIKKILSACVGVDLFACRIQFKKDENVETCASEQVLFLPQLLLILQSDWLICRCRFQLELWKIYFYDNCYYSRNWLANLKKKQRFTGKCSSASWHFVKDFRVVRLA